MGYALGQRSKASVVASWPLVEACERPPRGVRAAANGPERRVEFVLHSRHEITEGAHLGLEQSLELPLLLGGMSFLEVGGRYDRSARCLRDDRRHATDGCHEDGLDVRAGATWNRPAVLIY